MKKKARIIPIRPDLENDLFDIPDDLREIMKAIGGMQANLGKSGIPCQCRNGKAHWL